MARVEPHVAARVNDLVAQQVVFKPRFQVVGLNQQTLGILGVAVLAKGLERLGKSPDAGIVVLLLQQLVKFVGRSQLEQT